jgi:thiamine transporter
VVLDYLVAFAVVGLAEMFSRPFGKRRLAGYSVGAVAVCLIRFLSSFLSGVIFFGSYAPEGMSPVLYSFAYNIFYIGGEAALTLAVLAVPSVRRTVESLKGGYH